MTTAKYNAASPGRGNRTRGAARRRGWTQTFRLGAGTFLERVTSLELRQMADTLEAMRLGMTFSLDESRALREILSELDRRDHDY